MEDEKKQGLESLFVTYEQGLALKELGFDEDCFGYYGLNNIEDKLFFDIDPDDGELTSLNQNQFYHNNLSEVGRVSAPLKQQVFKFFREEYNIDSHIEKYISSEGDDEYFYMADDVESINFETYEEAESACIDKLIMMVKSEL